MDLVPLKKHSLTRAQFHIRGWGDGTVKCDRLLCNHQIAGHGWRPDRQQYRFRSGRRYLGRRNSE
jgi:hypothetical protein